MRLKGKYPQWNYWMAMTFMSPVPWEADAFYAQPGMSDVGLSLDRWPVGTGPYMMEVYEKDRRHVMVRNPNYRGEPYPCEGSPGDREAGMLDDCGKKTPFIDRIVITVERERTPQRAKFRQGFYDLEVFERTDTGLDYYVAKQDSNEIRKEYDDKGFRLDRFDDVNSYVIGFNMLDPVIGKGDTPQQQEKNRKLRQAISIAVDWEEYSKIFPEKAGATAMGPLPKGIFGSREGTLEGVNPISHRVVDGRIQRRPIEDAKKLMVEAGWPEGRNAVTGQPLVINYDFYALPTPERKVEIDWVVRQFAKLNIQLEVARHRQQPVPGQGAQGQAPGLLDGLERRLPGCRELPRAVLRPEREERVGRREHAELHRSGVRPDVQGTAHARRRPGQAGADRQDGHEAAPGRTVDLGLLPVCRRGRAALGSTTLSRPSWSATTGATCASTRRSAWRACRNGTTRCGGR